MRKILAALVLALALSPAAAQAADPSNAYTWSEAYIPTSDPGVELHADVLRPRGLAATARTPVIMVAGPYLNHSGETIVDFDPTRSGPDAYYTDLIEQGRIFANGYTMVLLDLRGFGGSSGCNDFGGPGEQADVKTGVEWAAKQAWSNGKVGMYGKSYDGWTEIMGLATRPKGLAAMVVMAPIIDGYRALYMNGVHYATGWYATPAVYQSQDAMPGTVNDSPEYHAHTALGTNPACYAANLGQQTAFVDRDDPAGFWSARDLVPRAKGSSVPVFFAHGFMDANAKPDNFLDVWSTLTGPHRAWFGQYDHVRPNDPRNMGGRTGFSAEVMRWFDRYLKGSRTTGVENDPPVEVQEGNGRWRTEAAWPPADAAPFTMPVKPGSYTDDRNNNGEGAGAGVGTWSVSQKLPYDVHLAGVARLAAQVTSSAPRANLVALLYDISDAGTATLITRGASAVKQTGPVAFDFYPQDWRLLAGHRIGLLVAGADELWFTPPHSQSTVTVNGGSLRLPALRRLRVSDLSGGITPAMRSRRPFTVPAATLSGSAVHAKLPPAQTP
jgi:predicted acyl esterase